MNSRSESIHNTLCHLTNIRSYDIFGLTSKAFLYVC
ncbi:Uncharacterised protein [Segatella copri]|nr:Uncharacterised protein [Segatella copri]